MTILGVKTIFTFLAEKNSAILPIQETKLGDLKQKKKLN